jgi:hypothetical protein
MKTIYGVCRLFFNYLVSGKPHLAARPQNYFFARKLPHLTNEVTH